MTSLNLETPQLTAKPRLPRWVRAVALLSLSLIASVVAWRLHLIHKPWFLHSQAETDAIAALRGLQSVEEIGVNYPEYSRRVQDAKVLVDRYLDHSSEGDPLREKIALAMRIHALTVTTWQERINHSGPFASEDFSVALDVLSVKTGIPDLPQVVQATEAAAKQVDEAAVRRRAKESHDDFVKISHGNYTVTLAQEEDLIRMNLRNEIVGRVFTVQFLWQCSDSVLAEVRKLAA